MGQFEFFIENLDWIRMEIYRFFFLMRLKITQGKGDKEELLLKKENLELQAQNIQLTAQLMNRHLPEIQASLKDVTDKLRTLEEKKKK